MVMWIQNISSVSWTDPRSATSATAERIGLAVWSNVNREADPCVLGRPAKRDISQARGERFRAWMGV